MNKKEDKRLAEFLYEVGTMRKLLRSHRQLLLTDDLSDNIASHSYRVAIIGWILAKKEGLDPYKVLVMCLLHDLGEVRTNDHNYLHKRYIKEYEDQINEEQLGTLPFDDFFEIMKEYKARKTKEAIVSKDADLLDQVLLLKEYAWQGNNEAKTWLRAKGYEDSNVQLRNLKSKSAQELGQTLYDETPSDWWNNLWTPKKRKK
tara:strand:+ start:3795 stop:4400 length:606 start_codon:yes stop_codon:yes gene_type:complete